jgi:hypothetical protein
MLELGKLTQDDLEFEARLGYIGTMNLKKKKKKKPKIKTQVNSINVYHCQSVEHKSQIQRKIKETKTLRSRTV